MKCNERPGVGRLNFSWQWKKYWVFLGKFDGREMFAMHLVEQICYEVTKGKCDFIMEETA